MLSETWETVSFSSTELPCFLLSLPPCLFIIFLAFFSCSLYHGWRRWLSGSASPALPFYLTTASRERLLLPEYLRPQQQQGMRKSGSSNLCRPRARWPACELVACVFLRVCTRLFRSPPFLQHPAINLLWHTNRIYEPICLRQTCLIWKGKGGWNKKKPCSETKLLLWLLELNAS